MTTNQRPTSKPKVPVKNPPSRISNWSGAFRDVLVASLNKGQFPVAFVLIILGIIFWRMPEKELSVFVFNLLDRFENNYILGWFFFLVSLFGWYFHNRYVVKVHRIEMERNTSEKVDLQNKLLEIAKK
ncbi:hypothetical protein [Flavobacterium sp. SORGH_AS_0622]|uniref:hypothetical protein n=1 Tax=Flavobacterium sp. SORGH_AS_0622 TaxID=3041772 RepID=UPI00278B32F6|nr:hypothetical protein [Flavobacterium sp. SORGH_AS_0622]MDQ1164621.1 hypothetical protein [Flavobacterium sp. SORGH_AS_0622]